MTALAVIDRSTKLALKDKPLPEVAEAMLGGLPSEVAPHDFPPLPAPLEANAETRKSFATLSKVFNKVIMTSRRRLSEGELEELGQEYIDLKNVMDLLETRAEQIKEYVRTHQDVVAEESGVAFPAVITRNGNTIVEATPRDPKGHYLLAAPKNPEVTEIPGTNGVKFSTEYRSGKVTTDLDEITRMYESGELDEETYKAVTRVVRVPDAERIRAHALKTGDATLLSKVVRRGLASTALCLRGLPRKK